MKSQEYLFKEIDDLLEKFPSLIFKYKFDNTDNTHIISVDPLEKYESDKKYIEAESDFVFDFENKYFPETIMFVSSNSLIKVDEPDKVFFKFEFVQAYQPKQSYNFRFNYDHIETGNIEHEFALAA